MVLGVTQILWPSQKGLEHDIFKAFYPYVYKQVLLINFKRECRSGQTGMTQDHVA